MRRFIGLSCFALVLFGCGGEPTERAERTDDPTSADSTSQPGDPSGTATSSARQPPDQDTSAPGGTPRETVSPSAPSAAPTRTGPARFDPVAARRTVGVLAGKIGPRMATGPAYRRAATYVAQRFTDLGYLLRRQRVEVPAGQTWGQPVPAGTSANIIAEPAGFDPTRPHLVIGAHLDSVPQAPGAEDNASGVATMVELARLASGSARPAPSAAPDATPTTRASRAAAAGDRPRLPVVFIAFGAEEPRGEGDDRHHYGSRHYVAELSVKRRQAIQAMISLDRVGVDGGDVRVRTGGRAASAPADQLRALGDRIGVATSGGHDTASDHWSFEKAGVPAAELGGHAFAGYHNASDRPGVVEPAQLRRTGRLVWTWLTRR